MHQKNNNHRKIKQTFFPTPQTRIEERHSQSQQNWVCLQHSNPLQLICLNCQNKLLCSQCVQSPSHFSHDIKSMERAKQMIYSQYQQCMIRLSSKSQILDIIHVQFEANKSQINSFSKLYKQKLTNQFSEIIACFQAKLQDLLRTIDGFIRQYIFQMSTNMERIRSKRKEIQKIIIRYDKERLDSVYLPELATYSYDIRRKIQEYLDDNDITAYKQKLIDPEWRLSNDAFQEIKEKIKSININFKQSNKLHHEEEKPKRKQRKDIKINQYNDRQKSQNKLKNSASSNPFISTLTPKNKSKQKRIKQKKSPDMQILRKRKKSSAKMISMPASPAKEVESTYLATPELSRKKLFKKK